MSATPLADEILVTVPTGAQLGKISVKPSKTGPDIKQIKKIYEFWQETFADLGEDVFKDENTATITFARAVPNELMDKMAIFKERNKILDTGSLEEADQKLERQFLIKLSGCLVSFAEIEAFIGSEKEKIFEDLKALRAAATGVVKKIDLDAVNRGIRACRELSDLIRKISYCKKIGNEFKLDYYEVLALYRQEGALALTPFKNSYPFGTLIATQKGSCRPPDVAVNLKGMIEQERKIETLCKRPGFNLVYSTSLKTISDESFRMIMITANLLVTGGVDIILKNNPTTDDELSQLFVQNLRASKKLRDLYDNLNGKIEAGFLQDLFSIVFMGLMMFILESENHNNNIPSVFDMSSAALETLNNLFKSHSIEKKSNRNKGQLINICLVGNQREPDTFLCLRIQAMWYSTRKFSYTLLAIKDRNDDFKKLPPFSPFATYLRFHAGELTFLGILIRILKGFPVLKDFWSKPYNNKNAPSIPIFPVFEKADTDIIDSVFNDIKGITDTSNNPIKPWISLGLAEYYIKSKKMPVWFVAKDLKTSAGGSKIAAIALSILTIIKKYKLVDTLNTVLEFTPIKVFFETKVFEKDDIKGKRLFRSRIFTKAHSFERLRLVYKLADENPVKKTE